MENASRVISNHSLRMAKLQRRNILLNGTFCQTTHSLKLKNHVMLTQKSVTTFVAASDHDSHHYEQRIQTTDSHHYKQTTDSHHYEQITDSHHYEQRRLTPITISRPLTPIPMTRGVRSLTPITMTRGVRP